MVCSDEEIQYLSIIVDHITQTCTWAPFMLNFNMYTEISLHVHTAIA